MRQRRIAALFVAAAGAATPAAAGEISVYAAVSLSDALQEIGKAFEASSGNKVVFNLGGSNDLARQIQAGGSADIFFSADRAQMDGLERAGLVRHAASTEALSNTLVVIVPTESTTRVSGPADLVSLKRLAMADPEAVPAGVYARNYLQSKGLWTKLEERVVPTLNVRAALAAVESGGVDAGLVYRTDAATSRRVRVAFEVPHEDGPGIAYFLAPLAASLKPATRDFVRYLTSPPAMAVFEKYGFLPAIPVRK